VESKSSHKIYRSVFTCHYIFFDEHLCLTRAFIPFRLEFEVNLESLGLSEFQESK
jgi:hypothetical protein